MYGLSMTLSALKIVHLLQAFSSLICSTAVQHLTYDLFAIAKFLPARR